MLMESAIAHALIEEKMNPFPDPDQKASQNSQSTRTKQHHYDSRVDHSQRPCMQSDWLQVAKRESKDRQVQFSPGIYAVRKPR